MRGGQRADGQDDDGGAERDEGDVEREQELERAAT